MQPPANWPSFTSEWHVDTYESIDPERAELSLKDKRIVISGGGAGIGRGLTQAFADAGASSIAILGRREAMLKETQSTVTSNNKTVTVSTHVADITDIKAVHTAAEAIGEWDILVCNAGYMSKADNIVDADPEEWWKGYEINVKGNFNLMQAFLPKRSSTATIVALNAGAIQITGPWTKKHSSYNSSKFGALKFFEILGEEHPDIHIVSFHPGIIDTDMARNSEMQPAAFDTLELPSHFAVWLCSEEAKFLRGRFVWCNWDVEQLKAKKEDIQKSLQLTANVIGWPFHP